jgi:hypothetical protein
MIRTAHRAQLSRGLSFPLGAEVLARGLGAAPHADELCVVFDDGQGASAVAFQRVLAAGSPYVVLWVEYAPARSLPYVVPVGPPESWGIRVYPVVSAQRQTARRLLEREGFPAVRQWLASSVAPGWGRGYRRLEFLFDPAAGTLTPREFREPGTG